jgi:ABC-type lipoprotein release transport system permease subunit
MRLRTLQLRSLAFHWRTNVAVVLAVTAAGAALTGALLVGDSMRESLRETAVGCLGRVDHALVATRFFRAALADELAPAGQPGAAPLHTAPLIILRGSATHADTQARVNRVNLLGIEARFWTLDANDRAGELPPMPIGRSVILNEPLANDLHAKVGDDILLRVGKPAAVSTETLLGRRDDTTATLRLTVQAIAAIDGLGLFSLNPQHLRPRNAFVPLDVLQRALDRRDRTNAILLAAARQSEYRTIERVQDLLRERFVIEDLGLRVRLDERRRYLSLESDAMLLEPPIETAALEAAAEIGARTASVLTYLANSIAIDTGRPIRTPSASERAIRTPSASERAIRTPSASERAIPYSTVSAIDANAPALIGMTLNDGSAAPALKPGQILLNQWAADDLNAAAESRIRLTYFVAGPFGRLETRTSDFTLRGVVRLEGPADDPGFTPEYPGVTDVENVADWDPPFPVDLSKVREQDEHYWDRHRAAPKAFISLQDGRRIWAERGERFGRVTSIRIYPADGGDLAALQESFVRELRQRLDPAALGLRFEALRDNALAASRGSTDFGGLFIGFSFFLIISAAMLVALLFRLGVERRSHEIGLLLAVGFAPRKVARLLITEGALVAGVGSALGVVAAAGYAWLMLAGLRTMWSAAANAPFLKLHASASSVALGFALSFLTALLSIALSIRGLTRLSPRALLAGVVQAARSTAIRGRRRFAPAVALTFLAIAVVLVALGALDALPRTGAFFGSGAAMLVACLALAKHRINSEPRTVISAPGRRAWTLLGLRNAPRNPGRSMTTITLVASATFVIAALQAFHLEAEPSSRARTSGSGGFSLFAEAAAGLPYDLNTPHGRDSLNLDPSAQKALAGVDVIPFRLRPGDDASCLNLYLPTRQRIIGATDAMIQRGGFAFSSSLAERQDQKQNPWSLLNRRFDDGAIPVIGDEAAVLWQLHLGLGQDLRIKDDRGRDATLRFVALLSGSVLQSELIVSEAAFETLFPTQTGHAFFLIDAPPNRADDLERTLERELTPFGLDVARTADRLNDYLAVQNTYLSTFQSLGGLGLLLGTIGLTAVLLRNVWERRSELALLRALGFRALAIGWIVLVENAALVATGLICGVVPALLAIAPHIAARPQTVPWLSLGLTLASVFVVAVTASAAALAPALRAPLLSALRSE